MTKVIIFGTGKLYQHTKQNFRTDIRIVAFLDNNPALWGSVLDGVTIYGPQELDGLSYDFIFLLSIYEQEMRKQLTEAGISAGKIFDRNQMERLCVSRPAFWYGKLPQKNGCKKVLLASHALTSTGAPNVLFTAACVLSENGCQVMVVSLEDGVLRKRFQAYGIPVVIMENCHCDNPEFRQLLMWADQVLVNTIRLYYMAEECLSLQKKVLWWIHETVEFEYVDRSLFARADGAGLLSVYVVSPLIQRLLREKFGHDLNIGELLFGIPLRETGEKEIFSQKRKIFALIGVTGRIKGQDILIQAVELLSEDERKRAEFWLVGAGEMAEETLRKVSEYPCIKILGEIEHRKIPELYSRIDAVVCCSRQESMSVVVAEGCMYKKLVLVSDAAGIAEYVTDGEDGLIFESENVSQLASLISWVLAHEEQAKRMGNMARKIYERNFTMEVFQKHLLEAMKGLDD